MAAVQSPVGADFPSSVPHKLRILIVDDNQINLSVLSTLLKRRFSTLIDGAPITVDSGLKAIQLLRTNVFDLILMDIQMPFLSGLDATLRIRNGEDDVLEANAHAHIVAVTTAVGDEPEAAYRRAGMDGMIGKPVRFQDMHHYITPLAHEAQRSASSVSPVTIDGRSVVPPLPPVASRYERLFYLPANATIRAPRPDICQGADFEKMLKSQTRASLRKSGALIYGQNSSTVTRSPSRRHANAESRPSDRLNDSINEEDVHADVTNTYDANIRHGEEAIPNLPSSSSARRHVRHSTMTINKMTLSEQIKREMDNMEGQDSDSAVEASASRIRNLKRPVAVHRASSPAWLMSLEGRGEFDDISSGTPSCDVLTINPVHLALPTRPKWLVALKDKGGSRSHDETTISRSSSVSQNSEESAISSTDFPFDSLCAPRRDSHQSSASDLSDLSTDVTTPSNESPSFDVLHAIRGVDYKARQRAESSSSNNTIAGVANALNVKTSDTLNGGSDVEESEIVSSPLELTGRRSFSSAEVSKLSRGVRQLGLAP